MRTLEDLQDELEKCRESAATIMSSGQSWQSPEGMTYTRANINALYQRIDYLEARISLLDNSGAFNVQPFCFPGRQ